MKTGRWNVRTHGRNESSNSERRTGMAAKELVRYDIDIAALFVTMLREKGQLAESGWVTFSFGWVIQRVRNIGVGFTIRIELTKILEQPQRISVRLM